MVLLFWKEQAPQGVVTNSVDFNFFSEQIEEVSGVKTDAGSIRCVKQSSNVCLLSGCMIEAAATSTGGSVHDPRSVTLTNAAFVGGDAWGFVIAKLLRWIRTTTDLRHIARNGALH